MSVNWEQLDLAELRAKAVDCYRRGGGSRPDVLVIEIDGQRAVLKDHNRMDKRFARIVGPLLVWREAKALRKLQNLPGVPALLAVPDRRALLMEYVNARQVVNLQNEPVHWESYFDSLTHLISQMHQLGVAHGDLRSPTNALIDEQGNAALVDFVASLHRAHRFNWPHNALYKKLCMVDLSAVTKLKRRLAPELLGANDVEASEIAGRSGMAARALGQRIRIWARRLFADS